MIQDIFRLQNPWRYDQSYVFDLKPRAVFDTLTDQLSNELLIGLIGSRQVGKSSLLYLLIEYLQQNGTPPASIFYFNLDDFHLHQIFQSVSTFLEFIGKDHERKYVIVDEIQRLPEPGLILKQIYDLKRNIKIIYSGSSQLEIKSKTREHLVGRTRIFQINRLCLNEYMDFAAPVTRREAMHDIMIYGSYPAVAIQSSKTEKILRIKDIYQSYVQKDLVEFLALEKTDAYNKLLIRLANQTGDLLNINDLANKLRIKRQEVESYIAILEQTFICKRIYPFYRNYNKEIIKTPKLYFLDLGLRNYMINQFNSPDLRNDTGRLFENLYLNELIASDFHCLNKINYWRTTNQTEIDFIIHKPEGVVEANEVKWDNATTPKAFKTLTAYYPAINTRVITPDDL
jgi:predicted AAA+ superfamily ATPase